ncbi:ferric reduction oxidase 2-like isoform X2 [Malania oleifera]|uniref:ferric reduction oxidase 2-like isoform X2 n=1 Tax=Malania oleifera TaxID=397392 RepID=UPI0025AECB1C|nr:ferric reduction oxidase 2-like isoform X2 [Malania oleifera]
MVLLLGSLLLWVMMPTTTYRQKWLPRIRASTNSTLFGAQGAILLIYSFPVLLISVLGCFYVHLGANKLKNHSHDHHIERRERLGMLMKRAVAVKGPLGIVSWTEGAFLTMFIALLLWSFSTYLNISFATITPSSAAKMGQKLWEAKLKSAALRLGLVGNICLSVLFFPVTRGSSVLPVFGLTSEGSIKYHVWIGHITLILFTAHGLCFIIYWALTHQLSKQMLEWGKTKESNVAGELALLAGLAMWLTTFPRIRRKLFELFFYTHYLYILFVFFFILHVGIGYSCIMLPGFYLFLLDRFLRFLQSRQRVRLVSVRLLPCETLELNFSKSLGLQYTPTSIMFINVPNISKLQWHPFTVTSNSNLEPERLSIVIKGEGSWSQKLYQMLSSPSSIDNNHLDVSIEGPYGPASTHFQRHDTLVLVSGGSGITPFISIIRELIFASTIMKLKTPKVLLICAFKNSSSLTMLDLLLPITASPSQLSNLQLQIEAYVTREKEPKTTPTTESQNLIRTTWFNPNPSDAPVSSILGPNHWLWLGAIISSSFVSFLLLMGVITRYYIYPIDHSLTKTNPASPRALLNMLCICICIAMTASAAVLWNKKQNAKKQGMTQSMDVPSPLVSQGSWFYNADRELESLPYQSLVQSTIVHYGERPDLKRMILGCGGSSVGVLASGPKKLRREVAAICSSGFADNLLFESISFSW